MTDMDITLTPTEAAASALYVAETREKKCARCLHRVDLEESFVCGKGRNVEYAMESDELCRKFRVDQDRERWLV